MKDGPVLVDPCERVGSRGPSYYPIESLAETWCAMGLPSRRRNSVAARLLKGYPAPRLPSRIGVKRELIPLMGPRMDWLDLRSRIGRPALLCWDVWPSNGQRWAAVFAQVRPSAVFITARQSAETWSRRLDVPVHWLPEATSPDRYDASRPLSGRTIDVLELGRRDAAFHETVSASLRRDGRRHLFEPRPGEVIFPTQAEMISGLAQTKIMVCFPSSRTHPKRSGNVETMTHRYLEAMASGALPVGAAPTEMVDFFGYDPVVRVESGCELEIVERVLGNLEHYQAIVDRNLRAVRRLGSWRARLPEVIQKLAPQGSVA